MPMTAPGISATDTKKAPAIAAALGAAVIALSTLCGAWFFQYVLGIVPCPLCLEQRYAYYLLIPLGFALAFAAPRGLGRGVLVAGLVLMAIAALANAGLGAYHSGVEFKYPFYSNTAMSSTIFSSTRKT